MSGLLWTRRQRWRLSVSADLVFLLSVEHLETASFPIDFGLSLCLASATRLFLFFEQLLGASFFFALAVGFSGRLLWWLCLWLGLRLGLGPWLDGI